MRFSCEQSKLRSVLAGARRAVPPNPARVAFGALALEVRGTQLRCTGSDGDLSITSFAKVKRSDDGTVLVSPAALVSYLDHIERGVEVSVEHAANSDLLVTPAGGEPYSFRTMQGSFPAPNPSGVEMLRIDPAGFAAAAEAVAHAADSDVRLVLNADGFRLDATDHYRLASASSIGFAGVDTTEAVVSLSALKEIARIAPHSLAVSRRGRSVWARGDHALVCVRMTERSYPNVESMLTRWAGPVASVERAGFRSAVSRLEAVSGGTALELSMADASLCLAATNHDHGAGSETVALAGPVPQFTCKLSGEFLSDVLNAARCERIELAWTGPQQPLFFRCTTGVELTCVVMPTG